MSDQNNVSEKDVSQNPRVLEECCVTLTENNDCTEDSNVSLNDENHDSAVINFCSEQSLRINLHSNQCKKDSAKDGSCSESVFTLNTCSLREDVSFENKSLLDAEITPRSGGGEAGKRNLPSQQDSSSSTNQKCCSEESKTDNLKNLGDEIKVAKKYPYPTSMNEILDGLNSNDHFRIYFSTQAIRKISHNKKHSLIEAGILPKLVEYLSSNDTKLQFEAAWALTNIASGTSEDTMAVVDAGAIPKLVELLESSDDCLTEQAAWALGNIAGDGTDARDLVLEFGTMPLILALIKVDTKIESLRTITWTISNFCRFKDPPYFEIFKPCLWYLKSLMYHNDSDVLSHATWALAYVSDGSNDKIQAVIDTGVVPRLVELLAVNDTAILTPAIRTLGNIVTGNDSQTERFLIAGGIYKLERLLLHDNKRIVKETVWTVSNILAGNVDQIQSVINAGLIPHLINILKHGENRSRREAAWAISNLTAGGLITQISHAIKCGIVQAMCENLDSKENELVSVTLDAISHLLQVAEQIRKDHDVANMIKLNGGLNKLKQIKRNVSKLDPNYEKVKKILTKYFWDNI